MDNPGMRQLAEQWRERQEEKWCDEAVPALAGLTPRQAAEDPSRREALRRLLDSYGSGDDGSLFLGLRPDRLRRLLKLDPKAIP
jgi:hypothetical protein